MYLIDKLETWRFWAFLVYRQDKRNALDIIFSDSHGVIDFGSHTEKKHIEGVSSENAVS